MSVITDLLQNFQDPLLQQSLETCVLEILRNHLRLELCETQEYGFGGNYERSLEVKLLLDDGGSHPLIISQSSISLAR